MLAQIQFIAKKDIGALLATPTDGQGFKLSCTQCGKCCTSGPQMTFAEAFNLRNVFVMRLFINTSTVPNIQRGRLDIFVDFGAHTSGGDHTSSAHFISPGVLQFKTGKCSALLESGACGIYERRPSICKSVPFASLSSGDDFTKRLESFGHRYGCVTKDENSSIDVDGLNENRRAIRDDVLAMYQAASLIRAVTEDPPDAGLSSISTVFICGVYDLLASEQNKDTPNSADPSKGRQFAEAQLALINREISAAMIRKNKADVAVTRSYRSMAKELERYLSKQIGI